MLDWGKYIAVADNPKGYPIDLTIGEDKVVMDNPNDKGQAELVAEKKTKRNRKKEAVTT